MVKRAVGGDGSFAFASQALGNFSLATVNGVAQRNFPNLAPGTYDLSESVPVSWTLSSATCSDGSSPASINLARGRDGGLRLHQPEAGHHRRGKADASAATAASPSAARSWAALP